MDDYLKAYAAAARFLGFRPRSVAEVRKKLAEKEFSRDTIDRVIEELLAAKYLDDTGYALLYIHSVADKYGERRIRDTLRRRGVSSADINAAFIAARNIETEEAEECEDAPELNAAIALILKRYGEIPKDPKERQRAKGFLVRRGFSFETADAALSYKEN